MLHRNCCIRYIGKCRLNATFRLPSTFLAPRGINCYARSKEAVLPQYLWQKTRVGRVQSCSFKPPGYVVVDTFTDVVTTPDPKEGRFASLGSRISTYQHRSSTWTHRKRCYSAARCRWTMGPNFANGSDRTIASLKIQDKSKAGIAGRTLALRERA